ncbi:hypothetical protein NM688_g6038 [Phlebia brevispora]|uniref:Uncharacterized protein n=1 Tax=Phlebia brevispora TaxID=194682 RepID=A0ACC1SKP6_9APHY|nr:hypothetical protein NM688_g6038 [Phlebia brevispora]
MSSNTNQSVKNNPNQLNAGKVNLPGFRELFSEFVVQGEQNDEPRSTTPNTNAVPTSASSSASHAQHGSSLGQDASTSYSNITVTQHSHAGTTPPAPGQQPHAGGSVLPSEEKKHICATCGKGFSRASSLMTHYNSHTGEKPFVCPFPGCGSRFSVKSNMLRHYRTHPGTE